MKKDVYVFVNSIFDHKMDDTFVPLEIEMMQKHDWDLVSLQWPTDIDSGRLVYNRQQ